MRIELDYSELEKKLPALLLPTLLNAEVKKEELEAVASLAVLAVLDQALVNIEPR